MPRRRLVMIAVVVLAVVASALLIWRGEGLTGPVVLLGLGGVVLLQLDTRRRLASVAEGQRRAASALHTIHRDQDRVRDDLTRTQHAQTRKTERSIAGLHTITDELASQTETGRRHQSRMLRSLVRNSQTPTQAQAQLQLQALFGPEAPLPIVSGWAMEPTALMELVDVVRRRRPRLVVECGSGTSTLWLAYALRRNGTGRVVSLEHQSEFAAATRQMLADHDLTEWAEVRDAVLTATDTPRGEMPWYGADTSDLATIDLLVVDGPPSATGPLARYPALPVLARALGPDSLILFDDADREDEQAVLQAWRELWDLDLERDVAGRALLLRVVGSGTAPSAHDAADHLSGAGSDSPQRSALDDPGVSSSA